MSNFISIKWDRFLTEGEGAYFPWLKEIQATTDLEEIQAIVESDRFKKIGGGSFRKVYEPVGDPEHVIKVIHDPDHYKMRMNEDDFDTAKRYPFIFPKAYVHAEDFSWIVMEKTPPLIYPEDMQKVLDRSFPAEQEALLNTTNLPDKDALFGDQWNLADPFHIMKMIMGSFRFNRKDPPRQAEPDAHEKALAYLAIDKYEIGRGNIGHDKDYNFKIVDSSVFDPDWDPDPEYFVDGRWTAKK